MKGGGCQGGKEMRKGCQGSTLTSRQLQGAALACVDGGGACVRACVQRMWCGVRGVGVVPHGSHSQA